MSAKDPRLIRSFKYAINGLKIAAKYEPNIKIHMFLAALSILGALILGFSTTEWTILVLTITVVFILELINTSLEAVVDLVSPQIRNNAKVAKDVSAGSVFIAAVASLIIVALLFGPKALALFNQLKK